MPDAVTIFVVPPSLSELERRLRNRGTESDETVRARLERARQEYNEADFYDYIVINDDVEKAADELSAIINAERCRFANRAFILENN
jgi:guanylate kinase